MKTKVLILGASGMLGSIVLDYLSKQPDLVITAPTREEIVRIRFLGAFKGYDYIINCIGITKQKIKDPEETITINSIFPYYINSHKSPKCKVIQITTDCVYSGKGDGGYKEEDRHDAEDIYGKSKSLGEVNDKNFYNIRTSIIGIDRKHVSLLSWFIAQKGEVRGYDHHYWNGITTLHFAKLCYAIIRYNRTLPNVLHFRPKYAVTKYELLKIIKSVFKSKVKIKKYNSTKIVDRTLDTYSPSLNYGLWQDMGYKVPPSVEEMVKEFYEYIKK